HTFVLYRHEKNHHQANVALLREVVAMDPTTHFGQGAQGMLKLMGEAVGEEMNVRPQPLALKPRIGLELQAKKPLTINKTIPVYAYASLMLSPETIETIRQRRGGAAFLERFFSDQTWAEDFFGSGPAKPSWDACFLILEEIAWQVPLTDRGLKKWATAAALNAGEGNREAVLRLMVALADIRARKLLVRGVEELPVGLLRYVVTPGQTTAEELLWLAKTHNVPPRAYSGVCWYAPYRLDNFFGDSIHGAHYYVPWDHAYNRREASRKVGGVCGSLSYYGSLAAKAHGLPSTPGGQPAHCAYSLFVPSEKRWWLCYNVNPYTGAHFQMWHYSFDYLPLAADLFLAPSRKEALRLFWKAEVARLRSEPAVVRSPMTCKIYANWNERTLPKSTALPPLTREDKNVRSFTADQGGEGLLERTLLVWNGTYEVKRPTEVRFTLASDDGADLTLDGKVLITNDGCHGMSPAKEAVVLLAPGKHPFEVRYFNYGGGRGLSLDATPTVAFSTERMAAFARAAHKAPAGYDLFVAWEKWLAQAKGAPTEAWITFAEAVVKGLANHPRPAWDLLSRTAIPAIQKAKGEDALAQQLAAWHGIIRQDDRPVAEFCDFAAILKQQATLLKTDAQKLTLFRGALSGQFDTRDAFGIVMRWGGEVFLKEDGLAQQYVAIVSDVLREKGAAADMGNFLDGAIRKASEAGNLTAFQRLSDLCNTLRPPASRQPLKLTFTQAPLLSDKGLLRTSTTSNWDQPGNYRAVIDGQTAIGNFHTASESAPWAEVELPGMADISAVYIENIHTQNNSRAVPFNVTISQNGKDWKKVANATTSQETWQFTFPPVKGRFVRVTWTGNADAKTFLHFRKFTVHGKKLY
ncbi:MAG: discoidin domain-containing protein, partial [Kiritimatiellae bacterium]|nr:discoidin domain-containing protein [Kiritimatiellia bacterium]